MRIVFFGASSLGYSCCEHILKNGYNVVGIYTLPSEFDIKYRTEAKSSVVKNVLHKDFTDFQGRYGVPVSVVDEGIKEHVEGISSLSPDLIIVIGWYFLLPKSIMSLPSKGCIGIHGSLLPKYRGNAPLVWAMINGETETGVSLFYFADGIDNGDIIGQGSFTIEAEDDISDVLVKAEMTSLKLLSDHLPEIQNNTVQRIQQNDAEATYFPRREPKDGLIDWGWDANRIRDFVRAQTRPYPGAFTIIGDKKVILWDASVINVP